MFHWAAAHGGVKLKANIGRYPDGYDVPEGQGKGRVIVEDSRISTNMNFINWNFSGGSSLEKRNVREDGPPIWHGCNGNATVSVREAQH